MSEERSSAEATRLEGLWGGQFGDDYVDRNTGFDHREGFWNERLQELDCRRVLEIGCNVGGNLQWIAQHLEARDVYGVDVTAPDQDTTGIDQPDNCGRRGERSRRSTLISRPRRSPSSPASAESRFSRVWLPSALNAARSSLSDGSAIRLPRSPPVPGAVDA